MFPFHSLNGRALTCGALATLSFLGCGSSSPSDEDQVKAVTRDYLQALGSRDYAKGCDQLAASGKADVVEIVTAQVPEVGTTDCQAIFKQLIDLTDEQALRVLDDVNVTSVTITGDEATATVQGATQRPTLRKIDGVWKITDLQTPETDGSPAAVPEEGPPSQGSDMQIDPLAFISAAGSAGDDINNARFEGDVLVLELAGDPADIEPEDVRVACPDLRDEFEASSVEIETPDGARTPSC